MEKIKEKEEKTKVTDNSYRFKSILRDLNEELDRVTLRDLANNEQLQTELNQIVISIQDFLKMIQNILLMA